MSRFPRVAALAALLIATVPATAVAKKHKPKPNTVSVMSRNLYLGADLTPGLEAPDFNAFVDAAGTILDQVDANDFRIRAKGLAAEIKSQKPDLVGLQEAALWRTAPCHLIIPPAPPTATTVRYDFIALLLARLGGQYKVAVSQDEFDFEAEANTDHSSDHSCDTNGRLTMRDAILVRKGSGVKTRSPKAGHFDTLLAPKLVGLVTVPVTRGWTSVDVKARKSKWFHFVNTHFEAFDSKASNPTNKGTSVGNGEVRQAQAQELVTLNGAARSKYPVVLVGDLNSDKATEVKPGDGLAYKAVLAAGFKERSALTPLGCCLNDSWLASPPYGLPTDFDHKVDHVMTNKPTKVKLLKSAVTGRTPVNGFWDSDHAGLFSKLRVP